MNGFLLGFLSTFALFTVSLALAGVAVKILHAKKPKEEKQAENNVVYYLSQTKPKQRSPKPVAIKGTLLSAEELNALLAAKRKK